MCAFLASIFQVALLTGTPVQNCTAELFSLLNLLDPSKFADADEFAARFGDVTTPEQAASSSCCVRSTLYVCHAILCAQVSQLQKLLKPVMLRRLKDDVAAGEIPAKEETIIWVELTSRQRKLYRGERHNDSSRNNSSHNDSSHNDSSHNNGSHNNSSHDQNRSDYNRRARQELRDARG